MHLQQHYPSEEQSSQTVLEKSENLKAERGKKEQEKQGVCTMHLDGAANRESVGAGIWIINPDIGKSKLCSYKLVFDCTNNVAEYEPLILGLQNLKKLGARRIVVYRDS